MQLVHLSTHPLQSQSSLIRQASPSKSSISAHSLGSVAWLKTSAKQWDQRQQAKKEPKVTGYSWHLIKREETDTHRWWQRRWENNSLKQCSQMEDTCMSKIWLWYDFIGSETREISYKVIESSVIKHRWSCLARQGGASIKAAWYPQAHMTESDIQWMRSMKGRHIINQWNELVWHISPLRSTWMPPSSIQHLSRVSIRTLISNHKMNREHTLLSGAGLLAQRGLKLLLLCWKGCVYFSICMCLCGYR